MEYPDEYAQIMEKMLADNAVAAEAVVAGARTEQLAAAAELQMALQALQETEENAAQILQDYTDQHRARLEMDLREDLLKALALQLLQKGEAVSTVADLLEIGEGLVREIAKRQGRRKVGSLEAWLNYEESGRSGYVIFNYGKTSHRFSYEFGGGTALVVIDIPTASQWEAHTGLSLSDREAVLEFIGAQVAADKAPEYQYRIENQEIVIYI
ncbi:MAG: hypothetical protein ABIQ93_01750 [Saprospiraceae bacterium]